MLLIYFQVCLPLVVGKGQIIRLAVMGRSGPMGGGRAKKKKLMKERTAALLKKQNEGMFHISDPYFDFQLYLKKNSE
jgi:hypothetical protein